MNAMNKYKAYYTTISRRLIDTGVITQDESDKIARVDTRKESYWKRHILDLCNYTEKKIHRDNIQNPIALAICATTRKILEYAS